MGVTKIPFLYLILIIMNCLTEYLFNKMMLSIGILKKKNHLFRFVCAASRILWLFLCAWFLFPIPVLLIGLFLLLYLDALPYQNRKLLMNSFILIIYLTFISILMTIIGIAGLLTFDLKHMLQDTGIRALILIITFLTFNLISLFLLRYHLGSLWKADYDKFKVLIYTRFLIICITYHILDSLFLALYHTSRINFMLLISGDILILILIYTFFNYNYIFEKSERMKKKYEENEILIAQQYFEKDALKKLSGFDSLTNAYNRREIGSIMTELIQAGHKLACVFIDLDGLKQINDNYGHTYGDLMLKHFADACMLSLKKNEYLARIGGDEFLLIFPDQEISRIENRIKELQSKLLEPSEEKEKISFSYGISFDEESVDSYINLADQRMYECKNRKRCINL